MNVSSYLGSGTSLEDTWYFDPGSLEEVEGPPTAKDSILSLDAELPFVLILEFFPRLQTLNYLDD